MWVRGGIGPHVAAGCIAAGAAGVVLDGALLLARESPIRPAWREQIARWDGSETTVVGPRKGPEFASSRHREPARWRAADGRYGGRRGMGVRRFPTTSAGRPVSAWPVGQDAAFADRLARKYVTVGGIVQAVERSIAEGVAAARDARPLAESSALAQAHGTRYPILQGPMTRVSDVPGFAEAVARWRRLAVSGSGAAARSRRCVLSCGMPRGNSRDGRGAWAFWASCHPSCAPSNWPWCGSSAPVRSVRRRTPRPGGRPGTRGDRDLPARPVARTCSTSISATDRVASCSRAASAAGTSARGRASSSGSRPSAVVADAIDRGIAADEVSLVFAGGIHDARSAALVAALAGPLAARGVKVGILVGTAYLFTREAVDHRCDRARGSRTRSFAATRPCCSSRSGPPGAGEPHTVRRCGSRKSDSGC